MHWCAQIAAESPLCWMANIAMQAPLLLSGRLTNPLAANLAPDLNNEKVLARVGQLSYLHIHEPSKPFAFTPFIKQLQRGEGDDEEI